MYTDSYFYSLCDRHSHLGPINDSNAMLSNDIFTSKGKFYFSIYCITSKQISILGYFPQFSKGANNSSLYILLKFSVQDFGSIVK